MNSTRNKIYTHLNPLLTEDGSNKTNLDYKHKLIKLQPPTIPPKQNTRTNAKIFEGLTVFKPDGNEIYLSDLWLDGPVLLKLLPKLDCEAALYEAKFMTEFQISFEKNNVRMVVILGKDLDLATFLSSGFWKWETYLDPGKNVFKAAGLVKPTWFSKLNHLFSNINSNNFNNTHFVQSGETLLINSNNKIVYTFRQSKDAKYPDMKKIFKLIGGDMDEYNESE